MDAVKQPPSAGAKFLRALIAVIFGVIFLGERLTWLQWAACGLVLLGVFISRRAPVKHAKTEPRTE